MNKFQFTQDGFNALKVEYAELTSSKRDKAIDRLQKARAMGDLSENSEYTAAKEDLAFIEGRVRELDTLMKDAVIINPNASRGAISIGSAVRLDNGGRKERYTIVGEFEADPMEKKLSSTSPIGKALLGKKKGETVEIQVPAGKLMYKIIEIENLV